MISLDHIAIGASSLEMGASYLKDKLGVDIPFGGVHDVMGTHNHLMSLGDAYFELIAVNPEAPQPERIRWFTLDNPDTKDRLAKRPHALCWVVQTDDLDSVVANSPVPLGEIVSLSRGDRHWRLTVPQDGSLLEGGLLPAFIEWSPGIHPSKAQPDLGIRCKSIILTHPEPDYLQSLTDALAISHLVEIRRGDNALIFEMETEQGTILLD